MNKAIKTLIGVVGLIALVNFSGCYYDTEEALYPGNTDCDTTSISYAVDVEPIILAKCGYEGCHGANFPSANISLNNHANIVGTVNANVLLSSITHDGNASFMPKNGNRLPECEILTIQQWIYEGQPNN